MKQLAATGPSSERKQTYRGTTLVLISVLMWSSIGIFVRYLHMDVWSMVGWRSLFAFITLALMLFFLRQRAGFSQRIRLGTREVITAVVMSFSMFFYVAALKITTVAGVMTIYATTPFLTLGLGWLILRESISLRAVICCVVSLTGVIIMAGLSGSGESPVGLLFAFFMASGFAGSIVLAKKWQEINLPFVTALACLFCMTACFMMSPSGSEVPGPEEMLWLLVFSLMTQSLSFILYLSGGRHIPALLAGLIGQFDLILAPLWVWLFFSEEPSIPTLTGGAITFFAVIVYLLTELRLSGGAVS